MELPYSLRGLVLIIMAYGDHSYSNYHNSFHYVRSYISPGIECGYTSRYYSIHFSEIHFLHLYRGNNELMYPFGWAMASRHLVKQDKNITMKVFLNQLALTSVGFER